MGKLWFVLDMAIDAVQYQPVTSMTVGVLALVAIVTYIIAEV